MHKSFCILLSAILGVAGLQAQDKWGLQRCVDYASQNNISVKQQEVQASLSALNERQARNNVYPNANFSNSTGMQFGRSVNPTTNLFATTQLLFQGFNLNADVVIYNWQKVKNSIIAAKYNSKAAEASVEKARNDIALSVATSFLQALLNREQIGITSTI